MTAKTDIEIAQAAHMRHICRIAATAGIPEMYLEQYGSYKAKVDLRFLQDLKDRPDGKLILVTAISPTPAGEGKTTTSIGLVDGLRREEGLTVVSTLHDLALAGQYADRLVLLSHGRVVAAGSPAEVLTEDALAEHYGATAEVVTGPDGVRVHPVRPR